MYVTAEMIRAMEQRFGAPEEVELAYAMTEFEFTMVRRSQKHGRSHDVTLFITDDDRAVVIKKPMYPPGAFRAPSGGLEPGEDFEAGARREAYEETGLAIELRRYVLRARVRFTFGEDFIDWTTHVFTARAIGGELKPVDTREIVEARWLSFDEMRGPVRDALLASGSTGLRYRAELGDLVLRRLAEGEREERA